ncbi:N-acyl-L-homoserine lactone synthetase [Amylibacter kogurei]|uniref:N-acyl-L-homoserine lactone synthetase n=1 Tax=Paramylibacter kogurei TaxID=1889778 RepID=A0A2G5K3E1_9RHOB|nr:acyl-homoserine-lactone synthase [Amylibacter kogurei]PIB23915.1 N-acyl-L-homoserine lactone synthetase [Amylibacter kogurei]
MQTTTLSFDNIHHHGDLFSNLLRARRNCFIVEKEWDLPEADGMEYDQYDNPSSRWIAVHENNQILAGVRMTPTNARCGIYSYMIRDAQRGLLDSIPANLMDAEAPVAANIWEGSRVFVSSHVPAEQRMKVQMNLMSELIKASREKGATQLFGLVPALWPRWVRRLGIEANAAGPVLKIDGVPHQVAQMHLGTHLH